MLADVGVAPAFLTIIVFIAFAILTDFLLELFSLRLTLATGRLQKFLFFSYGRNLTTDGLISCTFQFLGFRNRSYFLQMMSFFNVGAFTKRQIVCIITGAFIGIGLSSFILVFPHLYLAASFMGAGFILNILTRDQWRDLGMAFLSLGMVYLSLYLFSGALGVMAIDVWGLPLSDYFFIGAVIFTSAFFRTPLPFLILLTLMILLKQVEVLWLPVLLFLHSVTNLSTFYFHFLQRKRRYYFAIGTTVLLQIIQVVVAMGAVLYWGEGILQFLTAPTFIEGFPRVILVYSAYNASLLLIVPVLTFLLGFHFIQNQISGRNQSQKIMPPIYRGRVFSLHLSLFLLHQEFVKMSTLVHTIFKLGRETDEDQQAINQKLRKYKGILERVGAELKELCFSVGKQRAYRWHIQEILDYYKTVNQLELIVDDLSVIFEYLQTEGLSEELERECRYWLKLQLHAYEGFFTKLTGVEDFGQSHEDNREKSYEVLDRIFATRDKDPELNDLSKVFYRVTENVGAIS